MVFITRVSTRGRITIPIELRMKLGWNGPMKVIFREIGGKVLIEAFDEKTSRAEAALLGPYSASSRTT